MDGRHAIITDTHATPADVHDVRPYLARLDRQIERFGFDPFAVGLDAGYASAAIAKGLDERGIRGCVGYARPAHREGYLRKRDFAWLGPETDAYQCPEGQILDYATTDKHGYRHYKSDPALCRACPLLASCTASRNTQKIITRHVWQDAKDRVDANRLTAWGKRIYKRRKETVERSFADAKQLHGHRYARMRGLLRWPSSACWPPGRPEHQEDRPDPDPHRRLPHRMDHRDRPLRRVSSDQATKSRSRRLKTKNPAENRPRSSAV